MDGKTFDVWSRAVVQARSRRGLTRLLAGLALGGPLTFVARREAGAKKKHKKHKQHHGSAPPDSPSPPMSPPPPASSPPPTPVLTYQCPGPADTYVLSGVPGTVRVAQAFVAAQSGSLAQIQLEVIKFAGSTGDYLIELLTAVNDVPTNTVLAHSTIPNDTVPEGTATLTASFAGPPVVAGTPYAAAVSRPGGSQFRFTVRTGNACPGRGFVQDQSGSSAFVDLATLFFGELMDLIATVTVLA